MHFAGGVEGGQLVRSWSGFGSRGWIGLPVELFVGGAGCIFSWYRFGVKWNEGFAGSRSDAVDRAMLVGVLMHRDMRLDDVVLLCRDFDWRFKDGCAMAVLAGSCWVDAIGGRGVGGLVLCELYRDGGFVLGLRLFFDGLGNGLGSRLRL